MAKKGSNNKEKIQRLGRILNIFKDQDFLNSLGQTWRRRVVERTTRKNIDVEGVPFRDYSEGHLKRRKKAGLGSDVDLIFRRTDNITMLNQIEHLVTKDLSGVVMFFENRGSREGEPTAEQLAIYHNIEGAGKSRVIRKFWGLTDKDIEDLTEIVTERFDEFLNTNLK